MIFYLMYGFMFSFKLYLPFSLLFFIFTRLNILFIVLLLQLLHELRKAVVHLNICIQLRSFFIVRLNLGLVYLADGLITVL